MDRTNWKDKVVIVTGASSGIGAAIAIKFASEGAKVALIGRNREKLKNVAQKCEQAGGKALTVPADVAKDDDAKRIVTTTVTHFGKIDVLVNNAGIARFLSILDDKAVETFDEVMATNLRAVVVITHYAAPYLVKTKGNIINISSVAALHTLTPILFAYGASKAAMDHFTRCVALDLSSKGIRVNSINPGPVKTDIIENMGLDPAQSDAMFETWKGATALNRVADCEEVADLALFLASDKARSITGSVFVTDNGVLLKGQVSVQF